LKNKYSVKEFESKRFLTALREAFIKSQDLYTRAVSIDSKVCKAPISFNEIMEIVESYFSKPNNYGQRDGKFKLEPYGRMCLNLSTSNSKVVLEVSLATALTYNSVQIYSYSLENYAVNMYLITLINETLKRFLAVNYIVFQIGEAPKIKNVFYIEYDNSIKFSSGKKGKLEDFSLNCLLVKSRA